MKSLIVSLAFFAALSAQASTYRCFSTEEGFEPEISLSVSESRTTMNEGVTFKYRQVNITKRGEANRPYAGVGTVTSKKIDMTLIQGGDIAMGYLKVSANGVPGRMSGSLTVVDLVTKMEVSCEVVK